MVQMRYIGEMNLVFAHMGKTRIIRPGQIIDIPKRVLKTMNSQRRALFEEIDPVKARILRLERAVIFLAKEIKELKEQIP